MNTSDNATILDVINHWLQKAVIGLNLCPFAKAVHVKQQIRYVVSEARDVEALLSDLVTELIFLADADAAKVETTLLIHPYVLTDFMDYNDFLDLADHALVQLDLEGVLQIASFHPDYQFAGSDVDGIDNFTNRSPFPILHLLREESIDQAVKAFPQADAIFEKNIQTLRDLGHVGWRTLMQR